MTGYSTQDAYYTAMVTAASNYSDPRTQQMRRCPPAEVMASYHHSNAFSSANSSSSTGSGPANMTRGAQYHSSLQRLPTTGAAPANANANTSLRSTNTSVSTATTSKTYTHNPYSCVVTTGLHTGSKDTSFNTSMDSYQSFHAAYADLATAPPPLPQQPLRPPQQRSAYRANPRPNAAGGGNANSSTTSTGSSGQAQPVYAPSSGDHRMLSSNLTEQFTTAVGNLAATACSSKGRHLLISVMRLQHLDKIELIYAELLPRLNTVALDPQGCHVMRTLIEFLTREQMAAMIPHLQPNTILEMATATQNTRRALQAIFERHHGVALTPIVEVIASSSQRLATTQQGCIAIMRVIENGMREQKQLLVSSLLPVLPMLTMDPFGNYVVQCILDNVDECTSMNIVGNAFAGHWVPLSCNKFASNVMEKVVRGADTFTRAGLVEELVFEPRNLQCLMQDGFGNFVLQAIIDSEPSADVFSRVYALVGEQVHSSPYGHKIEARLKCKYNSLFGKEPPRTKPMRELREPRQPRE